MTNTREENKLSNKSEELDWSEREQLELESRILKLRDDQIAALLYIVGLNFSRNDIEEVVVDIRKNEHKSGHLPILIFEANSKENLLWWLDYFEKQNKKSLKSPRNTLSS